MEDGKKKDQPRHEPKDREQLGEDVFVCGAIALQTAREAVDLRFADGGAVKNSQQSNKWRTERRTNLDMPKPKDQEHLGGDVFVYGAIALQPRIGRR